jgi:predicted restriction endonuclease
LEANVEYRKVPLKAKVDTNIKEKNTFKIGNLETTRECGVITNAKFKARVKKLLDYKCKIQG